MNKHSRVSLAAISCAALCFTALQAQAQYQTDGTGISPTPPGVPQPGTMNEPMDAPASSTSGSSASGNYDNSMQSLPTEPTGAGYVNSSSPRYSWIPYTTSGYIGLSLGNGDIDASCTPGLRCEDPHGAVHIYTGGMITPYIGVQLGYFRLDDTERNGGETKISGVNLVLVGVLPLGSQFSLVGRAGGTYGWTDVSTGVGGVTLTDDDEKGFVPSYGAGVSWDFHRNLSLTLDWDRHHLKYPGGDKHDTDIATIGLKYRF